jgi:succinate dehydrogenase/fumarate reductase flavoprotein subunit
MKESSISRRDLIKGSVLAGAGALAAGALAACASPDDGGSGATAGSGAANNITWDKEVDVLVVGSGTSAIAALSVKGYSADTSVLIIEKSEIIFGGTTGTSGAAIWIPLNYWAKSQGYTDNRENAIATMKYAAAGRSSDELIEAYVDNGHQYLQWTHDTFGWDWIYGGGHDYFQGAPGDDPDDYWERTVMVDPGDTGGAAFAGMAFWPQLRAQLEENGVEIMMGTEATKLLRDESGVVIGATVTSPDGKINIKAAKGVVLGTGGFDFNPEMIRRYQPVRPYVSNAVTTNTGDGQRMGAEVGGALSLMDMNWGIPSFVPGPFNKDFDLDSDTVYSFELNDWFAYRGSPNAIVVNRYGQRFGNESSAYAIFNRAFNEWNSFTLDWQNVPAYFICDSEYFQYKTLPGQKAVGDPKPEYIVEATTLDDLAQKLGIDAAGLKSQVELFNGFAATGVDLQYHRGEKSCETLISGDHTEGRVLPNNCLGPIATAPFYGAVYVPGTCGTNGGLVIDKNARVLDMANEPIAGLYAVGNCSSGVSGGSYLGSGMTVGSGSVMSWLAAKHILGVE